MSITREVTVWCDYCANWEQVSGHTIRQARKEMKRRGWTVMRRPVMEDICPNCSRDIAAGKREQEDR